MKKLFLLSAIILFSALNANAVDWKPLDVATPNIDVYYDSDAIRNINNYEYCYTIRYQALGQSEKIAYIKANSKTKKIGIIWAGDYDPDGYRPNGYFATPHAIMKPIQEDSFLYYANDKIAKIVNNIILAVDTNDNAFVPVSYRTSLDAKNVLTPAEYTNYMNRVCELLKNNWNAPATTTEEKTTIKASIGTDGSLQSYRVVNNSNNDTSDRSAISTVERTVLYPKYTVADEDIKALNFQFTFINDLFKKSVVY